MSEIGDVAKKIISKAFYGLSLVQVGMEDIEKAIKSGMKALDMNPDDFEIYDALYSFLISNQDFEEAHEIFKQFEKKVNVNDFNQDNGKIIAKFYAKGLVLTHEAQPGVEISLEEIDSTIDDYLNNKMEQISEESVLTQEARNYLHQFMSNVGENADSIAMSGESNDVATD